MYLSRRIKKYAVENFGEVWHTTLNPEAPGVVRIHLIPPKYEGKKGEVPGKSIAIINGQDIIPVNFAWSILLCEFMREVNKYWGRPVRDEEIDKIIAATVRSVRRLFPFVGKRRITSDIWRMMNAFRAVAYRQPVEEEIGYMSLGEYAPYMRAPHRMDLMVSAMTKDGCWHCNQKCVHCYAAGQKQADEAELSAADWMHIIDRCRAAGIPQLTFTGGEPTMRADLVELIEHAKWFVTRLNTNGVKLTRELCDRLLAASLDSIQITFYSSDAAVHNTLVGAERWNDTVNGIRNALAAGLSVSVNTPLCTVNRDYRSTLEFLHSLGVIYVTCSGLITTGNAAGETSASMQLTTEELREILSDAAACCAENGMEISFTSPGWIEGEFFDQHNLTTPSCGACLSNMAVTPGGNVVPCQSWLSGEVLGNILSDEWETIWNAPGCVERREWSARMLGQCPLRRSK